MNLIRRLGAWMVGAFIAVGTTSCGGGANGAPPFSELVPFPTVPNAYVYASTVAIGGIPPPAPALFSFGISTLSASDGFYYLADRTNASIDVVSLATRTLVRQAAKGAFAGNVIKPAHAAGPNGVVAVGNDVVFAGDGNADVIVVDTNGGGVLAKIPIPKAALRVDLLGYDPVDHIVLALSDSSTPWPVGTFISSTAPYAVLGQITFTNATGGIDTATYDPNQSAFLQSITSTSTNPNGQLDVISPTTEQILSVIPFSKQCNPTGTSVLPSDVIAVSCGRDPVSNAPQNSVFIDGATGSVLATIPAANGCDQNWYNATDNRVTFTCSHAKVPVIVVVDATSYQVIASIAGSAGTNSVAVDPATKALFVPQYTAKNSAIGLNIFTYQ